MPDALALALATVGIGWLLAAQALAGAVYGFAGFGAALVFLPLAAMLVEPPVAVGVMACSALGAAATVLPRALRQSDSRQVGWVLLPALAALPPGVWLMAHADGTTLRWTICGIVAVTLAALVAGWRQRLPPGRAAMAAVGIAAGAIGGATGLHGPVVILFNLSGTRPVQMVRADMMVVLTCLGIAMLPVMALQGILSGATMWLGALVTPAFMAGTLIGQAAFDPSRARLYRGFGYLVVGAAVVAGLPLWD